jgi:hypothetical protein
MAMTMTDLRPLNYDVNAAIGRAKKGWDPVASHVDNEAAYLDRFVLAAEVVALREELAATQDAQHEAEREVETLQEALLNIDFE